MIPGNIAMKFEYKIKYRVSSSAGRYDDTYLYPCLEKALLKSLYVTVPVLDIRRMWVNRTI